MAVNQNIKLEVLCRLCLERPGWIDIHETHLLPQIIYSCTGIKVSLTDQLPRTVCKTCFEVVNSANHLRILANNNDMRLKELLKGNSLMCDFSKDPKNEENKLDSDNCYVKKETFDSENQDTDCVINAVDKEEPQLPVIIKVRTDLFTKPPNMEQKEENNRSTIDSMEYIQDSNFNKTIELKCDICSKLFETRKKLYLHKRLHNKTHTCTVASCEKKFATKGDLDKHIRTHTGERPFVCHFCEKGFTQSGTLKCHMESVHGMCKVEVREQYIFD